MVIKKNHNVDEENSSLDDKSCCGKCGKHHPYSGNVYVEKPSKKKFLLVALLLGGVVGLIVGVKYHNELSKSAVESWKTAEKNKKKYVTLSNAQLDKLAKDFHKAAKKIKK